MNKDDETAPSPPDARNTGKRPQWRHPLFRIWFALNLLLIVFFSALFVPGLEHLFSMPDDVTAQLEAIRHAGQPATYEDLEAWYPAVPDEDNAAVLIREASQLFREVSEPREHVPLLGYGAELLRRGDPLLGEDLAATRALLERAQGCLDLLRTAVAREHCAFSAGIPLWIDPLSPPSGRLRAMARLLVLNAMVNIEDGAPAPAVKSLLDSLRFAYTLRDEPGLIWRLDHMNLYLVGTCGLQWALNRVAIEDGHLAVLSSELLRADDPALLTEPLIVERCHGVHEFETYEVIHREALPPDDPRVWIRCRYLTGRHYQDYRMWLTCMGRFIDASQLSPPERAIAFGAVPPEVARPKGLSHPVVTALIPCLERHPMVHDRCVAHLRTARAALAVERFRIAYGHLPDHLDTLVPTYLDGVPVDPFDGKPIRYAHLPEGYVVYSIGQNLLDDGGIEAECAPNCTAEDAEEGDITFTVERNDTLE